MNSPSDPRRAETPAENPAEKSVLTPTEPQDGFFDDPRVVTWIIRGLIVACVLLTVADLFYDKHAHYGFEEYFGFFGFYGFVGCVFLVLSAAALRRLLQRDEDYYTRREESSSWILTFAHPTSWRKASEDQAPADDDAPPHPSHEGPDDPQDASKERAW